MTRMIPLETLELATALRAEGKSWNSIGRAVGFDGDVIRWRIDPVFVSKHRGRYNGHSSALIVRDRMTQADLEHLKRTIPPDTRSFTARAFGDPLPGRSALDKRRADEVGKSHGPVSPVRAERTYYLRGFLGPS